MNIAVIFRQVPDTEARITPNPQNKKSILEDDITFILNPYDEYAVEEAIRITEEKGGEAIGICIGPERAETTIRTTLAMGLHRAIHITEPDVIAADIISQAKLLAQIIRPLDVSMILCGREFIDTQEDAMAPALAEYLDFPHVLNASHISIIDHQIAIQREMEGNTITIQTHLPVVISCQKGLNEPRYPTVMAIRKSKSKEIKILSSSDIGFSLPAPRQKIIQYILPPSREASQVVAGEPNELVDRCIRWLSEKAKIV